MSTIPTMNDTTASRQWSLRPNDQRFLSLGELKASVEQRKRESWTATPNSKSLRVIPNEESGDVGVQVYDPSQGEERVLTPTNWGFGQLAQYAKAPASYLRQLPPTLAAINLQYGLEHNSLRDDMLLLGQSNGHNALRAMTSTSYGRIWDIDVVNAVERVNESGRWQIPASSYATKNPKRSTTLYASDRDVFIFLVDPHNPVQVGDDTLFRGFYTWNSEVGSQVFGLTCFLYRYICDNRIIWGQTKTKELKIRHTGGAPDRFIYEGQRYLERYADESSLGLEHDIQKAIAYEIPKASETNGVESWLQARGFSSALAKSAVAAARSEEGEARSLWDIVNGITAHARTIPHTDTRVDLERKAGNLMKLVSGQ